MVWSLKIKCDHIKTHKRMDFNAQKYIAHTHTHTHRLGYITFKFLSTVWSDVDLVWFFPLFLSESRLLCMSMKQVKISRHQYINVKNSYECAHLIFIYDYLWIFLAYSSKRNSIFGMIVAIMTVVCGCCYVSQ